MSPRRTPSALWISVGDARRVGSDKLAFKCARSVSFRDPEDLFSYVEGMDHTWWSGITWEDDHRKARNFKSAFLLLMDWDRVDGGKEPLNSDEHQSVCDLLASGALPHVAKGCRTDKGMHTVVVLEQPVTNYDDYLATYDYVAEEIGRAYAQMRASDGRLPHLVLDRAPRAATGLLYAPCADLRAVGKGVRNYCFLGNGEIPRVAIRKVRQPDVGPTPSPVRSADLDRDLCRTVQALARLGPDVAGPRNGEPGWFQVLTALHDLVEKYGAAADEFGLALADDWSSQAAVRAPDRSLSPDSPYQGREDVRRTWDSLGRKHGDRRTLASLTRWAGLRAPDAPAWENMPKRWANFLERNLEEVHADQGDVLDKIELTYTYDEDTELEARWAIHPLLQQGELGLLFATPKAGKTTLGLYLAWCALEGRDPLDGTWTLGEGWRARRVLVLTEMSPREARQFYTDLFDPGREHQGRIHFLHQDAEAVVAAGEASLVDAVTRAVDELGDVDLILVDTLTKWAMLEGGENLNDMGPPVRFFGGLRHLAYDRRIPALVVAHSRKTTNGGLAFEDILGSQAIRGSTSTNIGAVLHDEASTVVEVFIEGRDTQRLVALAQGAAARARGEPAPGPLGATERRWFLRLGWDGRRLQYVLAEESLLPDKGRSSQKKAERGEVHKVIRDGLFQLTKRAAERGEVVYAFSRDDVLAAVRKAWKTDEARRSRSNPREPSPGRPAVEDALRLMALADEPLVVHIPRGMYPGGPKDRGGWALTRFAPEPFGRAEEVPA